MRIRITIFFILMLCANNATGQGQNQPTKPRYVVVPSESAVLVAVSQPDSPIEILDSKLLNAVDGSRRAEFQYVLRNRVTKPVRYVSVYALVSTGMSNGASVQRSYDGQASHAWTEVVGRRAVTGNRRVNA